MTHLKITSPKVPTSKCHCTGGRASAYVFEAGTNIVTVLGVITKKTLTVDQCVMCQVLGETKRK